MLHLPDIRGVRPSHQEKARRLAEEGYAVLLLNVFYRTGRYPLFDFPLVVGEERSMRRMGELTGPLTPEAMERDAGAYVDFLLAQPAIVSDGVGVVGHCFTGAMALRTAAARPDRVLAAASFHGGGLYTEAPSSPHLALPRARARLYLGHADQDKSMPATSIAKLEEALVAWGGRFESEIYLGAAHGWTVSDSAAFNPEQRDRAFGKLVALLEETLPKPSR